MKTNDYINQLNKLGQQEIEEKLNTFYTFNSDLFQFFKAIDRQFLALINSNDNFSSIEAILTQTNTILPELSNLKFEISMLEDEKLSEYYRDDVIKTIKYVTEMMLVSEVEFTKQRLFSLFEQNSIKFDEELIKKENIKQQKLKTEQQEKENVRLKKEEKERKSKAEEELRQERERIEKFRINAEIKEKLRLEQEHKIAEQKRAEEQRIEVERKENLRLEEEKKRDEQIVKRENKNKLEVFKRTFNNSNKNNIERCDALLKYMQISPSYNLQMIVGDFDDLLLNFSIKELNETLVKVEYLNKEKPFYEGNYSDIKIVIAQAIHNIYKSEEAKTNYIEPKENKRQ